MASGPGARRPNATGRSRRERRRRRRRRGEEEEKEESWTPRKRRLINGDGNFSLPCSPTEKGGCITNQEVDWWKRQRNEERRIEMTADGG